jgi:hypothetical protein
MKLNYEQYNLQHSGSSPGYMRWNTLTTGLMKHASKACQKTKQCRCIWWEKTIFDTEESNNGWDGWNERTIDVKNVDPNIKKRYKTRFLWKKMKERWIKNVVYKIIQTDWKTNNKTMPCDGVVNIQVIRVKLYKSGFL